jgi:hypothetical protein
MTLDDMADVFGAERTLGAVIEADELTPEPENAALMLDGELL